MDEFCDLCRTSGLEPIYRPESGRGLSVYLCGRCGLVQSLPRIDRAPRRSAAISGDADWGNIRYGKGFRTQACLSLITGRCDLKAPLRLLDVGSNRASFARAFLDIAPAAEVTAVEPDERVADCAAGLPRTNLIPARIEEVLLPGESFDIVHSCHTIEHLASPAAVLAEHWRALKPYGLLVLDAPNIDMIGSDDILEEWFIDKHLHHFSAATLTRLLDAAGFERIEGPDPTDKQNLLIAAYKRSIATRPVAADLVEVERARDLFTAYQTNRARNLLALTAVAAELHRLSPRGVALWGAGRLFDALVRHGGFDPRSLKLLIDTHLKTHMPTRHGVALSAPEDLAGAAPGVIVVMSRAFAGEIAGMAAKVAPEAEIISYQDLLGRARQSRAA
jgi:2-polyprenyl-3-methyl-5-hydroxy-6-metoxy-1,4-benzoquinol methylase